MDETTFLWILFAVIVVALLFVTAAIRSMDRQRYHRIKDTGTGLHYRPRHSSEKG